MLYIEGKSLHRINFPSRPIVPHIPGLTSNAATGNEAHKSVHKKHATSTAPAPVIKSTKRPEVTEPNDSDESSESVSQEILVEFTTKRDSERAKEEYKLQIKPSRPTPVLPGTLSQAATEKAKNNAKPAVPVPVTRSTKKPEVILQPSDSEESLESSGQVKLVETTKTPDSKRAQGKFKLQNSVHQLRNPETHKESLPLEVVETLVMAIQENTHQKIPDIVKDIHNKLDIVSKKNYANTLRFGPKIYQIPIKPTEEPKNVVKEMDKILQAFLLKGKADIENAKGYLPFESDDDDDDNDVSEDEGPYMRADRDQPEGLEYDLDDGADDLHVAWHAV